MSFAESNETLEIRLILNSSCQDVFCKKCLALPDQNVELQVRNISGSDVFLLSALDLLGPEGALHIPNLFPHGEHRLGPGESMSLYTYIDEADMARFHTLVLRDSSGKEHSAPTELRGRGHEPPHTPSIYARD